MAKLKRRESGSHDVIEIEESIDSKLNAKIEEQKNKNEKEVENKSKTALERVYNDIINTPDDISRLNNLSDDEFINLIIKDASSFSAAKRKLFESLKSFHKIRTVSGYTAGRVLYIIRKSIREQKSEWKEYGNLETLVNEHKDHLGFSYSTAKEYIFLYENSTHKTSALGVKKIRELVNGLKDNSYQEKLALEALENNYTINALKNRIDDINDKVKNKKHKEKEYNETKKEFPIIEITNDNEKPGRCIIQLKNINEDLDKEDLNKIRDLYNNYVFDKYKESMQKDLYYLINKGVM